MENCMFYILLYTQRGPSLLRSHLNVFITLSGCKTAPHLPSFSGMISDFHILISEKQFLSKNSQTTRQFSVSLETLGL
ncbi:hypothetical protein XENTR_v10022003 [Xenopus tropicalis]|nr:hypothetical protein XENTR_v10022003 [Xenopus tropicalis]